MWYEIKRYPSLFEKNQKCNYVNFTLINNGEILIDKFAINYISGKEIRISSVARLTSNPSVAQLSLPFLKSNAEIITLDTDYKTYAVQLKCQTIGIMSYIFLFVLSRNTKLDYQTDEHIIELLDKQMIPTFPLRNVDQNNCQVTFK
ncbi:hypothetical protein PV326_011838 [Microctonus aethiopoides]|nr:hypothetical protein PV326_011838 [Microctonus aethiopoides]